MTSQHASETEPADRHIVVVGGGPAAHRFVEAFVARPSNARVTVLCEEPHQPYDRVALSTRLSGEVDLGLSPSLGDHPQVTLRTGQAATGIDPSRRVVRTEDGEIGYDELVLATGSDPLVPPITNAESGRVYRTLADVDALVAEITAVASATKRAPRVLVIGGGLLGLEAAGGAAGLGAEVSVVTSGPWLMDRQLDEGAGQALGRIIAEQGIQLYLGTRPTGIQTSPIGVVTGADLANGTHVEADIVVFSIGIRPRDELAVAADLSRGEFGGVRTDLNCQAGERIWAIGEVAAIDGGRPIGLVAPANAMAEVVSDRLHGGQAVFPGVDDATTLKLSGVDVASFGDAMAATAGSLAVVYADPARGLYQKLVVSDDGKTLLGGMFVGDASPYPSLRPLLGRELGAEPGAFLAAAGAEPPAGPELPDDVGVCSCNNVCAGTIRQTVKDGCSDLRDVMGCSRAGTQCGSCVPLVKKLFEAELRKSGIEVSKALCEHVSMSRSELFESVRILGLSSATEIFERYGIDGGCDICKPVIASVLATQTNGYILDDGQGALQDTNDRALANMQKDGTYSVVPRIPAGEITPQKLKVIAEVAEQFDLYTKITGGQRIDMFGARLEQLPQIWRILIDAGFESGQAYGKSLRTVKSCVGSTWCRYGVQDSVGMAIFLEERYRGLRSPHKLKLAVSGCARECAEARSKDVGVIATEAGWNLYVGGNGGFQPAHAQLLASDLDDQTLVRFIDRYLMYYVRTAERLQRTARWQEDLEGGLDHVREVVCADSLGIAAELEAAMATHVDSYRDEWAATLDSPERLRRFRSFVNAPDTPDPMVQVVTERGQRRPADTSERVDLGASIPVRPGGSP